MMDMESPTLIRAFKASEAETLSQLIVENLVEVNSLDYSAAIIEAMIPMYEPPRLIEKADDHLMLVCYQRERLVGTASLDGNRIRNVYVSVRHHGQGIGGRLMRELEQVASDQGFPSVTLHAAISAQGFYEKLGYRRVEIIERSIGRERIRLSKMEKKL